MRRNGRKRRLPAIVILACLLFLTGIFAAAAWLLPDRWGKAGPAAGQEAAPEGMHQLFAAHPEEGEIPQAGELRYKGKTYAYKSDMVTLLFMGIDKTGEAEASEDLYNGGQADALFLIALDPEGKTVSIIGISRDTMTEIAVSDRNGLYAGTRTGQIALAHAYGDGLKKSCENTADAVSRLFYGLPIHGYFALNMEAVALLNDAVGGVEVIIPEDASGADVEIDGRRYRPGWKAGERVRLMGKDAYTFIRYRDTGQAQSAGARLERQKDYLRAFIPQAVNAVKKDVTLPFTLYRTAAPYMVTDITLREAARLAEAAVSCGFSEENLYSLQGEVKEGELFEEFYPDETALYELILQVFYEEIPEGNIP